MLLFSLKSPLIDTFFKNLDSNTIEINSLNELNTEDKRLGGIVYVCAEKCAVEIKNILNLSDFYFFILVDENGKTRYIYGENGENVGQDYILSNHFKTASITYVHELNNHLAIINGRIYESKKIAKNLENPETSEKLQKSIGSIEEKVDKITQLSRFMTYRNSNAGFISEDEPVDIKGMVDSIGYDYRKVFEKYNNSFENLLGEFILKNDLVKVLEQFFIAASLKLASLTNLEESGTMTTITHLNIGKKDKIVLSCVGKTIQSFDGKLSFHQNWLNALATMSCLGFEVNQRSSEDKIEISIDIPNQFILNKL